jgi:UDP-N-acetyl-2-amino-2-deoxyglucuronate dehydrogenase
MVRFVIVGIGAIAAHFARSLAEIPSAKLVAGSCRGEEKGKAFAGKWGCEWFGDTERMLDQTKPDVAIICTPSGQHLEPALAAIARGVNVLCEKPLDVTVARVRQMIDAAKRAGVLLGGIFPQRFNPVNVLVRDAARDGRFGNLAIISASVPWWREDIYYAPGRWQGKVALDGGGALMNQATHTVDLMQWFAAATMPEIAPEQNPVVEVFARTAKRGHDEKLIEIEDTAVVTMQFRNGAFGQLLAATSMYPGSRRRYLVAGRDGTAEVVEDELAKFEFRQQRAGDEATLAQFANPTKHAGGSSDPMAFDYTPHKRNIEDYLAALAGGKQPLLSGEESLKAVQIVEACYESAKRNAPVSLSS